MEHDPEEYAFIGDILAKRMSEMRVRQLLCRNYNVEDESLLH